MLKKCINKFLIGSVFTIFYGISSAQQLLTKLQLDTCKVFSEMEEALRSPENVLVLDLSGNNVNALPAGIGKLKNLQRLNLANNNISVLPDELFNLKYLQELNLEENRLVELPSGIGNLTNLKKLNLTRTKIHKIPKTIANLKYLEYVNLSWNDLLAENIKPIFKLRSLRNLNLQRNLLETLNSEIGKLSELQILNLNFNPLVKLPEEIGNLSQLKELDLGKNTELIYIPESFKKLVKLEYLNLTDVPLSENEMKKLPDINQENIEL